MKVIVLNPGTKQTKNVMRDLIYGCWCKGKRIGGMQAPPLNLVYIATILKDNGHSVHLIDALAQHFDLEDIDGFIGWADAIIISTSTMSFKEDCKTLQECKEINPNIKTIMFGSHPTFMPEESLAPMVDIIVRKEPDFIIRDLVNNLNQRDDTWKSTAGIGYRVDGKAIINPDHDFEDFTNLPIPDRKMLPKDVDYFNPLVKRIPYTTMMTSRGCPALCSFCTVPSFYGNKLRTNTVEAVIKELEEIQKQGYKEVWIRDETFTVFKKRNEEICNEIIKRGINITWICNARVGSVDKQMMELMKKAGCHMIKFGVESGVQEILDNVKKGIKVEKTIETFKIAHEVGMDTHAHVMLGMPGDTHETINQTIKFVKQIDPTTASFGICTPYAGTPLFNEIKEKHPEIMDGSDCDLSKLHEKNFFNEYYTDLTPKELEQYVKKAYRSFYLRPIYLLKWLPKIMSIDELRRLTIAGSNVFSFSLGKK